MWLGDLTQHPRKTAVYSILLFTASNPILIDWNSPKAEGNRELKTNAYLSPTWFEWKLVLSLAKIMNRLKINVSKLSVVLTSFPRSSHHVGTGPSKAGNPVGVNTNITAIRHTNSSTNHSNIIIMLIIIPAVSHTNNISHSLNKHNKGCVRSGRAIRVFSIWGHLHI